MIHDEMRLNASRLHLDEQVYTGIYRYILVYTYIYTGIYRKCKQVEMRLKASMLHLDEQSQTSSCKSSNGSSAEDKCKEK